jgi:hypothetical protein
VTLSGEKRLSDLARLSNDTFRHSAPGPASA